MSDSGLLSWAKLLRLSLFPSALADPIAGAAVVGVYWPSALPLLGFGILASLCVYHGSMALNDWHDQKADQLAGRNRPLTNGALSPTAALLVGASLVLTGALLPYFAPRFLGTERGFAWIEFAAVAALATAYSFGLRGTFIGPALLGLCRAGNFAFGALVVAAGTGLDLWPAVPLVAALYFALVFTVSTLGRFEDGEAKATPEQLGLLAPRLLRRQVRILWALPLLLGALRFLQPTIAQAATVSQAMFWGTLLLGIALAFHYTAPLLKLSRTTEWNPAKVESVMGLCLSRFVPFSILVVLVSAYSWQGMLAAAFLHALALLGRRMMSVIPPS